MKNKLLILDVNPFGGLTDTVKWVEYLKNDWQVTLICFAAKDGSRAKADGFRLIQLKNFRNRRLKGGWFVLYTILYLLFYRGKVLVEYFPKCEVYKKFFSKKRMLLDIRTLSVSTNALKRRVHNEQLIRACSYFDKVTAISEGVAKQIGLQNIGILPLGSDVISKTEKTFTDGVRLLYVGTFTNRLIERTIEGVAVFQMKHIDVPIHYTIIGYGIDGEERLFKQLIKDNNAEKYIDLVGRVPHEHLAKYMDNCNVGLSFVPITDYYNDQPPTKTYEYCLSGMLCIATATSINKQLINNENGILIPDTVDGIVNGIECYWTNRERFQSTAIRETLKDCTWQQIVENILNPILTSL